MGDEQTQSKHREPGNWRRYVVYAAIILVASLGTWLIPKVVAIMRSRPQILVVLPTADNPFWIDMRLGVEKAALAISHKADIVIRTGSADADSKTQIELLKNYRERRAVKALVLGPASSVEVVPEVAAYNQAGIPVVVVDSRLDTKELIARKGHVDSFLGSNNSRGGELAAQEILRILGPGTHKVLLIEGSAGHETAVARSSGFLKAAPQEWTILRKDGNWERGRAREVMEAAQAGFGPTAVFACSDQMAMGAITALEKAGVPAERWPVIVGFDATAEGLRAVAAGKLAATIKQNPATIGEEAVRIAYALLRREPAQSTERLLDVELVRR